MFEPHSYNFWDGRSQRDSQLCAGFMRCGSLHHLCMYQEGLWGTPLGLHSLLPCSPQTLQVKLAAFNLQIFAVYTFFWTVV